MATRAIKRPLNDICLFCNLKAKQGGEQKNGCIFFWCLPRCILNQAEKEEEGEEKKEEEEEKEEEEKEKEELVAKLCFPT